MSPKYDSNMNNNHNNFIYSEIRMALSITLSYIGHLNYHSLSDRRFQHMTAMVLFHTHPNTNTSKTSLSDLSFQHGQQVCKNTKEREFKVCGGNAPLMLMEHVSLRMCLHSHSTLQL